MILNQDVLTNLVGCMSVFMGICFGVDWLVCKISTLFKRKESNA